ncbi:MAG TPA: quinolinate synthase NadA, partial [Solirubrobacteraceae bacterium]|nr:quinolinate synthase NadA [Solirubrobacteraceae bacterium]
GCSTSVMEYVAAGDVAAEGVHMLSTGGMLKYARDAERQAHDVAKDEAEHGAHGGEVVVATETGMLYPLKMAAPAIDFIPANAEASCRYMKMITLPKLRDSLRDGKFEVRVSAEVARRARVPIDRMVAIG